MIEEWNLLKTNLHHISKRQYEVAVLPIGATEAHNRHLPEGEDVLDATHVAQRCCELAWPKCESVICLPTLPYGVDCNLMAFPLSIHVSQATLDAIVRDIVISLHKHGIRKVVIINSHGGNNFTSFVRQIQSDLPVYVFLCNWWLVAKDHYDDIFDARDDHAGQWETSIALALHPELVEMENAGDGYIRPFRFAALEQGWVATSRDFAKLNDHCAIGNPAGASAEKGHKYIEIVCQRVSTFLAELANTPIDDRFPHVP